MKKVFLSASIAITVLCFTACDKVKDLIPAFDIVLPDVPVLIQPVATSANEVTLGTGSLNYDINAEIKKYVQSANIGSVSSIKLKAVRLSMPNATTDQNLSNFSSARVSLYSNANTTEIDLATATTTNDFSSQLTAIPTTADLKSYLSGSQYNYTLRGVVRQAITTPTSLVISATITVKP